MAFACPAFADNPGPSAAAPPPSLDSLFQQLKTTPERPAAKAVEAEILRRFNESGSDTVDLLADRAKQAILSGDYPLALDLLDQVVTLKPDYAEGWSKRATAHLLAEDYDEALADIHHALKLQPRHFGALAGLGFIYRGMGDQPHAMEAFGKALDLDPQLDSARRAVEEMKAEKAGVPI
ncbi:tetratricopeptide repeat protein [Faunimonas pinastri]|uniref:tetratricopeptide repeat protein n=1 Tax=Faunimonas pinastri TaxID=1855383 RepID=UPI0015A65A98|nr:tetratricopeptide repeat protein [Faunimonas pinastri]